MKDVSNLMLLLLFLLKIGPTPFLFAKARPALQICLTAILTGSLKLTIAFFVILKLHIASKMLSRSKERQNQTKISENFLCGENILKCQLKIALRHPLNVRT